MRILRKQSLALAGCAWLLLFLLLSPSFFPRLQAQQNNDPTQRLSIQNTTLPKSYLRQQYRFQFEAQGGTTPIHWYVTSGSLPKGMSLSDDGVLSGAPVEIGQFGFAVTAADSEKPNAHQQSLEFSLQVVASLFAQWGRYPAVNGPKISGSIKVSNQTGEDFDLTVIVLAVNENGRATTLGYQHFTLTKNARNMEIPFGENLASGSYIINADIVGEVPATNTIHRARLVSNEHLQIKPAP